MNPMLMQMQAWFGPNARVIRSLAVPPSRVMSTFIRPSTRAPITEPSTKPAPPVSRVPPMMTAAMASSSQPTPVMFCAMPSFEV